MKYVMLFYNNVLLLFPSVVLDSLMTFTSEQMKREKEINEVNLCLLKKNFSSCEFHFLSHSMILLF